MRLDPDRYTPVEFPRMSAPEDLRAEKERLVRRLSDSGWFVSAGVGMVENSPCIILAVRRGARAEASRAVDQLMLAAPVELREVEDVRIQR